MATTAAKRVLITGASQGIGAATAEEFATQGAELIVVARSQERLDEVVKLATRRGGQAVAIAGDVADYETLQEATEAAIKHYGGLDVLINNAGVIDPISSLGDSKPERWGIAIDVNLKGVYHGLRAAIPVMQSVGGGTIINMSSGAATSALEGWSHYCASKAAVLALTRCAHKEYADDGIRVVGLSPGTVATDMQVMIRDSGINPVSQLEWSTHIPTEWVARAAVFLCGEGGDQYLGDDFSLKNNAGRSAVGLPLIDD